MSDTSQATVVALYEALLKAWNDRDAEAFAAQFVDDGRVVGFDGSQMNGRREIASALKPIFAGHPTAAYVAKTQEVAAISSDVVVLRAIAGMIPPNQNGVKADVNAIQSLVALKQGTGYLIALFQNTPAAFHGRPQLVENMTRELQDVYSSGRRVAIGS